GKVQTWVNSRWKYPGLPGQFSVEINILACLPSPPQEDYGPHQARRCQGSKAELGWPMSAELALQKAIRARLVENETVSLLVPAANILDRNERPNPRPSIVIGEGQSVDEGDSIARTLTRVYMDLHVWVEEPSTEISKRISGAIRTAIKFAKLTDLDGFHFADCRVRGSRFLRDPDGKTSHAIVTIDALVQEVA
ncbi:DUF3168 domain-containing protein, partial [Agrobacterium sp. MAFF310724]